MREWLHPLAQHSALPDELGWQPQNTENVEITKWMRKTNHWEVTGQNAGNSGSVQLIQLLQFLRIKWLVQNLLNRVLGCFQLMLFPMLSIVGTENLIKIGMKIKKILKNVRQFHALVHAAKQSGAPPKWLGPKIWRRVGPSPECAKPMLRPRSMVADVTIFPKIYFHFLNLKDLLQVAASDSDWGCRFARWNNHTHSGMAAATHGTATGINQEGNEET